MSSINTYLQMMIMAGMFNGFNKKSNPLEGVDIEKEYKLIQQKKSTLSAVKRRMVVRVYESYKDKEHGSI